jgi:hypothetical protein
VGLLWRSGLRDKRQESGVGSLESPLNRASPGGAETRATDPTADSRLPTRPAHICAHLLSAIEASEGRRRRRKRDTTPDAIGLALKRRLLEGAVRDDPDPDGFEGWLLRQSEADNSGASGPARAMALEIWADWQLAERSGVFRRWLEEGAPSEDAASR